MFQIWPLSMAGGSHWQSPREEDLRRKPRATAKHMLHKRGLQASASSLVGHQRNPGATFFPNENRSTTKKKKKKKQITSAALKATSVNDDMLLTVVCFSRIWENSQKADIKKIRILYVGFKMTLRKRNLK